MSGTTSSGFNVGRDVSVVAILNGTRLDVTGLTDFEHRPRYDKPKHRPLNTPTQEMRIPDGHEFKFKIDRTSSSNDALFAQIEANWWAGGSRATGTVTFYITELDGSQSRYQATGVVMSLEDAGTAKQADAIIQSIEGFASTWQPV
jgi:hypothetical protein